MVAEFRKTICSIPDTGKTLTKKWRPKTCGSKTWTRRNDSSEISALLRRKSCAGSSAACTRSPRDDAHHTRRNCLDFAHCEECYCREPRIPPELTGEKMRKKNADNCECYKRTRTYPVNLERCYEPVPSEAVDSSNSRTNDGAGILIDPHENHKAYEDRELQEETSDDDEPSFPNLERGHDGIPRGRSSRDPPEQQIRKEVRFPESVLQENGSEVDEERLRSVTEFRKSNYFDCHSVENVREFPPHECVHKFVLNERLAPEPLLCDGFGISRCQVCFKPMKSTTLNEANYGPSKDTSQGSRLSRSSYFPATKIHFATGNERMELDVPEEIGRKYFGKEMKVRMKKNVPRDSLALRFQPGVI